MSALGYNSVQPEKASGELRVGRHVGEDRHLLSDGGRVGMLGPD